MNTCPNCYQVLPDEAFFCPTDGTALASIAEDALLGSIIAERYVLTERIGNGKSGTVYRGEHVAFRQPIAIKLMHQDLNEDAGSIDRIRQEAMMLVRINSPHMVKISDFGLTAEGRIFLAMELIEGMSLADVMKQQKTFDESSVCSILRQVGDVLSEVHALGLVHQDLRPRNIFLCHRKAQTDHVKLLEFGIAQMAGSVNTQDAAGISYVDPRYLSPEQARQEYVDPRSDIYALGVIAYELISGRLPFDGSDAQELITKHKSEWPYQNVQTIQRRPTEELQMEMVGFQGLTKRLTPV